MDEKESQLLAKRIELLREFEAKLRLWRTSKEGEVRRACREYLNRNAVAVQTAVREAGTLKLITISPPPIIGGLVSQNLNPFTNLFEDFYGHSLIPDAIDSIQQAIGVYEHMLNDTGLVRLGSRQAFDIESAIQRALRPAFQSGPPRDESAVQGAMEVILQSLGIEFTREKDVAAVGAKVFKPDFVVVSDSLAIEVKYSRPGRTLAQLQEEIAADVAAYSTKWKRLLIVVYDNGLIQDPYGFRRDNMKAFGVSLIVVKH